MSTGPEGCASMTAMACGAANRRECIIHKAGRASSATAALGLGGIIAPLRADVLLPNPDKVREESGKRASFQNLGSSEFRLSTSPQGRLASSAFARTFVFAWPGSEQIGRRRGPRRFCCCPLCLRGTFLFPSRVLCTVSLEGGGFNFEHYWLWWVALLQLVSSTRGCVRAVFPGTRSQRQWPISSRGVVESAELK